MNIKSKTFNDPIIIPNINSIKKDLLLLKEEALKDFTEIQKKVSDKYSKLDELITGKIYDYEKRLNSFECKIIQLSKIVNFDELLEEKVCGLISFKEKMENDFIKETIKLENLIKILNINIERIDKILSDSVIYPGIIGKNTKYKTFHEFIDYILTQLGLNSIFREKNIIDFKSYKTKIENSLKIFNIQLNSLLNTANEFTKTFVQESENKIKSWISLLEEKIFNIKIENTTYIIELKKNFKSLEQKINSLRIISKINNIDSGFTKGINFNKIEKKFKRYSTSQIKDYIIGRLNINDLLKQKKIKEIKDNNYYQNDIFNKRKSLDTLYIKKRKKHSSCFNFFSHDKINIRKSMFLANFRNDIEHNKNYINNSDLNTIIKYNTKDDKSNIKTTQFNVEGNSIINESINIKNIEQEKIMSLTKRKYSKEDISFSTIKSTNSFVNKKMFDNKKTNNLDNSNIFPSNIPIHYATVIEYNSKSNSTNCKNKQKKHNNISEIRPANNLILTAFLSKNK